MRKLLTVITSVALIALGSPAIATNTYGVDIYMSAPAVEATSHTSSIETETFDSLTVGDCPSSFSIGTVTAGSCTINPADEYGGASTDSPTPAVSGGTGTNYALTGADDLTVTITLNKSAKYLGLWWSAGNASNEIDFYDGSKRVAHMTTQSLMDLLGNSTVTSKGGSVYDSSDFNGNPRDTGLDAGEPFVYLNLYGFGGSTFDKIVLTGGGFEFDNISISDLAQTPGDSEVLVDSIPGETPPASLASTGSNYLGLVLAGLLAIASGLLVIRRKEIRANN